MKETIDIPFKGGHYPVGRAEVEKAFAEVAKHINSMIEVMAGMSDALVLLEQEQKQLAERTDPLQRSELKKRLEREAREAKEKNK